MNTQFSLTVGFLLVLLIFCCTSVDSKVDDSADTSLLDSKLVKKGNNDENIGSIKVSNSATAGNEKKDEHQVNNLKEDVQGIGDKIEKNSGSRHESKEALNDEKNGAGFREEGKKEGDKEEPKSGDDSVSKEVSKDIIKDGNGVSSASKRKDGEECDSSNKCSDEENNLVACLRVPGNESPHLSLLVQNKGKGPLKVKISAPDFVQLEKREIQLQEKEDKKVKVSINDGGNSGMIVLTAGSGGHCTLDFRDLIAHHTAKESDDFPKPSRISNLTKAPILTVLAFAAILGVALAALFISIRRKHLVSRSPKYQRLDMELPVSIGGKSVADNNDGWDNGWDDNWDDEAPHTPSMPVTPSLPSKSLASRRSNKEGWKD